MRTIQTSAEHRRKLREKQAAELAARKARDDAEQATRESWQTVSPNDLLARQEAQKWADYYYAIYLQKEAREKAELRNADIKTMADLKQSWDMERDESEKLRLLRAYVALYTKYSPTTEQSMHDYWVAEQRKKKIAALFGAAQ
jgi:hypothetical protein